MPVPTDRASAVSPEYALLGLVGLAPGHGYELHRRLQEELGEVWTVSLSQTYNILKRLEAKGYLRGRVRAQSRRPARCRYRLTAAGQRRFAAWLRSPTGLSVHAMRVDFVTRLYFAGRLDPPLVGELILRQRKTIVEGLKQLAAREERGARGPSLARLSLALRIRQLSSVLEWLGECDRALAPERRSGDAA